MLSFLLPFAKKIVTDAVNKIPDDGELGEKLIDLCIIVLEKAQMDQKGETKMHILELAPSNPTLRYAPF